MDANNRDIVDKLKRLFKPNLSTKFVKTTSNRSACRMSDYNKEKHDNHFNNRRKSEYSHTNESLLSLDNTLLCNIDADSELHISATFSQEFNDSVTNVCKEYIKTNRTAVSKITRGISSEINDWQDETLMNQVFAQFDSQYEKGNASDKCGNITNLDIFDTSCKEDINPKRANICLAGNNAKISLDKSDTSNLHKDETNNLSCLYIANIDNDTMKEDNFVCSPTQSDKDKSPVIQPKFRSLNKHNLPNKKLRLNDTLISEETRIKDMNSTEYPMFYGLSDIVKKLIQEVKGICELYQWQDECLKLAIRTKKNLIYALPTSGGKTLVAEILMLREIMCNEKNAIVILPYVALVQEKVQSMAIFALKLGFLVEEYAGTKGCYPPIKRRTKNSIYICTIEKALGLVNSLIETKRLDEIGIIIVDELHLLGESGGRGATLEGLLTKIMFFNDMIRLIGMSATIGNLKEIAQFLNADTYSQNFRPVKIIEYVKCEDCMWEVNLNNNQPSLNGIWIRVDPGTIVCTWLPKLLVLRGLMDNLGHKLYNNFAIKYPGDIAVLDPDKIGSLVMEVVPNDSCLIFCSSRKNCENVALLLTKVLPKSLGNHKMEAKRILLNVLKTEEGLCPILRKTLPFGVAYHHSGLTSEERHLLEDAFREGTLCIICCTSTLAAGVNLPARRVILRSPYVGNQFLNLSRYKQMIGRAGRAGMGVLGESILICKKFEISKVKNLLISQMDDSLSSLHVEKDRGINNLILSAIQLNMATTRFELHELTAATLLSIQQNRINVNVKNLTDETVTTLLKCGVIKIKSKSCKTSNHNVTVVIPSQESTATEKLLKSPKKEVKTITFTSETEFQLCDLGQAAMKGSIDLKTAYTLYEDLKIAQKHLILIDNLHLLYLVTPYDVVSQITLIGNIYYDVVMTLTDSQMQVARLLGITEAVASKIRDGITPKSVEKRVVERFYVTLIIYELWNHHSVYFVAEKYQINRGVVQNLLNTVSMFASSIVRFCQELPEFWAFTEMLSTFSKKLSYCCPAELELLMELPSIKIGRARQLYKAGYKTLQSIAKACPEDLKEQIPYLSYKIVVQITAAAKLLILQKVEDLRDECENVLDGINVSQLDVKL